MNAPLPRTIRAESEVVARSDAHATNSAQNRKSYVARVPIYPKDVHGTFRKIKWAAMAVLLAIYYVTPWIRWSRGAGAPSQAVLVDLAHERFYFFFVEIWPQEVYYITGLLIVAAVGIFLAAALFGRVWCGYACPQTVWTDLFIFVERMIEGDRGARIRLAAAPLTAGKLAKRASKHAIWLLIGALTGGAWVFYFTDVPTLAASLIHGNAPVAAYIFIGLFTFTTYCLGGLMREQICTYMCPWPRIQAAMTDDEALSVIYRRDRGEPRSAYHKGDSWENRGACIDCHQCVAACPMGIDIRDGAQLECIQCALCIDACDEIMDRVGRPHGLIAYTTTANLENATKGPRDGWRIIRPRTILYSVLIVAVGGLMVWSLLNRADTQLSVAPDRNPLFVMLSDGGLRDGYSVKITNKLEATRHFKISVSGLDGARLQFVEFDGQDPIIDVKPAEVRAVKFFVLIGPSERKELKGESTPITITATDTATGRVTSRATTFSGPAP